MLDVRRTSPPYMHILRCLWADQYPPVHPRCHSSVERALYTPVVLCRYCSLCNLRYLLKTPAARRSFMDAYVMAGVLLMIGLLFTAPPSHRLYAWIALYEITDIVTYRLYFICIKSQEDPWTPDTLRRSALLATINLFEVVVAFGILYLHFGTVVLSSQGGKALTSGISALYFSAVTILTIGYGDFIPADDRTRCLVIMEALSGLLFLAFLLPALVSILSSASPGHPSAPQTHEAGLSSTPDQAAGADKSSQHV